MSRPMTCFIVVLPWDIRVLPFTGYGWAFSTTRRAKLLHVNGAEAEGKAARLVFADYRVFGATPYQNASVLLPEPWRASTPRSQARLSQRHKVLGVERVAGLGQRVRISWRVWGRSPTCHAATAGR